MRIVSGIFVSLWLLYYRHRYHRYQQRRFTIDRRCVTCSCHRQSTVVTVYSSKLRLLGRHDDIIILLLFCVCWWWMRWYCIVWETPIRPWIHCPCTQADKSNDTILWEWTEHVWCGCYYYIDCKWQQTDLWQEQDQKIGWESWPKIKNLTLISG